MKCNSKCPVCQWCSWYRTMDGKCAHSPERIQEISEARQKVANAWAKAAKRAKEES